ncbi:MAG TPA: magnesium and cobalt transport protein CorA [Gallionella sp.]|nr:magnesium/cobalt transporter CorA [Gallionella sp.]OGS68034.1 MAG: magnesium and cobalt transport protein CorA [Gallionellales bacterium GWA2_54_124]HCI53492.1 magnesium and cobalt transport protein CorA [Gallionella sp.]
MLLNCVAYHHGVKIAEPSVEEISDYLARVDCFVWVALRDATEAELNTMQEEFGLHDLAVEDARHGHQRPKVEEYGDTLFVAMHLPEYVDGELAAGEVNVFVGRNFILSIRSRSSHNLLGVRERCEREPELLKLGSGFVLYALMDAVVDRYFPLIDKLELQLEAIEEHLFDKGYSLTTIAQLYGLKRKISVLKHAVMPLMEATSKLYGGRVPPICVNTQEYLRDVYDHLTRINSTIDMMRDTITTAILVSQSTVSIEQNEVNKRLAAWAAIFAVATAFVGIWGMNFQYMPELELEYGYPLALLVIIIICGLLYFRFKRAGWL